MMLDFAGGPDVSKEDIKWLNDKMVEFFNKVPMAS